MTPITENGLNSIRVGLEDYEQALKFGDDARMTSAVRNVYAGILILAKSKLYELSPAGTDGILIRDVRPELVSGRFELVPNGRKTIDYEDIKKRFKHFAIFLEWEKIERVRSIRNDLEHYYHSGPRVNVQEALADVAMVTRSLLAMLKLDPVRDLGERWWGILLKNEQLVAAELAACRETFSAVHWINQTAAAVTKYFACEQCSSPLIRQVDAHNVEQEDIVASCAACGAECEMKPLVVRAVTKWHFGELYDSQTRGGEAPIVRCPRCRLYVLDIDANECAVCGETLNSATGWCDVCRNPMTADEQHSGDHQCPAYFQQ